MLVTTMFQSVDFYYYSGMVRATDEEAIAVEKIVCYSSQRWGREHAMPHRATRGSTRVGQDVEGIGGKCEQEL